MKKEDIKKVVLAYSGGLDTSIIIPWLKENYNNCEVIAVSGDVGQGTELDGLEEKAKKTGASKLYILDLKKDFIENYIFPTLKFGAKYEDYLLGTSFARPCIAKALADIAIQEGADAICHGCTGKGNDQVRFEVSVQALDPDLKVIAPVRVWDLHTRPQEIAFAEAHGIPVAAKNGKPYSIDDNLWGRAIECGVLEDPWNEPPADIWETTADLADCPDTPEDVIVGFEGGKPCSLDGEKMSVQDVIVKLDAIAGRNGYGRLDQIENRLVGIKSRECYEVPGGLALITAHKALEDLCLERELLHYKLGLEHKWAELVYYGLWFSPLKKALDAFFASTQTLVTGEVKLRFIKGTCTVVGRRSEYSLYDYNLATYDEGDTFNRDSAAGFIEQWGLPSKVWAKHRKDTGNEGTI